MSRDSLSGARARSPFLLIPLVLHAFAPSVAQAATDDPDAEEPTIEETVKVTTRAVPAPASTTIEETAVAETNRNDLAAALRDEPGVSAVRRGPINLDPQVRGAREAELAILVDGTRTFGAGPGGMDSPLSHVNPHGIDRVRLLKGPYALTHGAGAFAAILVDTDHPRPGGTELGYGGTVRGAYTSNAEVADAFADLWVRTPSIGFGLSQGVRSGSDYESGDGTVVPASFDSRESHWSFAYQPTETLVLEYLGGYQVQNDVDYPGRSLDATYFHTDTHSLGLDWHRGGGLPLDVTAQVYYDAKEHLMNNDRKPTALPDPGRTPPFGVDVYFPTQSTTLGSRGEVVLHVRSLDVTLGGDLFQLEQDATRRISRRDTGMVMFEDIVWPDAVVDHAGLYAQVSGSAGDWTSAATLRLDRERSRPSTVSDYFREHASGSLDRDDADWSLSAITRRELGQGFHVSAGLGRVVRMPTVLERYSDRFPSTKLQTSAEVLGDPTLRPETSYQLDMAAGFASDAVALDGAVFYRRVRDFITVVPDATLEKRLPMSPSTVLRYVNGTAADFLGGELSLSQRLGHGFGYRASVDYIRGQDLELDEPVPALSPLGGRLALRYTVPSERAWLELAGNAVARQRRVAASRGERPTPGYTTLDLAAHVRIASAWSVQAGVTNLADVEYASHLNSVVPFTGQRVPEPGRQAWLSLDLRF